MVTTYLTCTNTTTHEYATATPTLISAPDSSHIISLLRKYSSSQLTNYVISMANYYSYAMLATLDILVKIGLPTTITIAGSHHQQIVHIQLNPHNKSILGRAYTNLFQNPLAQTMNSTVSIPQVHPTKSLTGRRSDEMAWATTRYRTRTP